MTSFVISKCEPSLNRLCYSETRNFFRSSSTQASDSISQVLLAFFLTLKQNFLLIRCSKNRSRIFVARRRNNSLMSAITSTQLALMPKWCNLKRVYTCLYYDQFRFLPFKLRNKSFREFHNYIIYIKSRDSSVGVALGYGLNDRGSRVRFPAGAGNFSLHHRVQNGSGVYRASYPVGTRGSFPGG
jgi:hypothetical protein